MSEQPTPKKPYQRADAAGLRARREAIRAGLAEGEALRQIASGVDVSYGRVRVTVHNDPALRALHRANKKTPIALPKIGALTASIRKQSKGFQAWLVDSVTPGTTLADLLVSIALDSYMDEGEDAPTQNESEPHD